MTTNRRSAGGLARRATAPRSWARPPGLALMALALVGLAQAGCRSDGCSNCNLGSKLTTGFNNGVQAVGRVFHHKDGGGCKTCGGSGGEYSGEGTVIDSGTPMSAPGSMIYPGPGTIIQAPSPESAPSQLEPIPASPTSSTGASTTGGSGGSNAANPASSRVAPANNRSSYEAYVPRRRPSNELARALHSTPDASARSSGDSTNLFDDIPPVDLPAEVTRKATPTSPATAPAPVIAPASPIVPTAAENHSAAEGAGAVPSPTVAASSGQAPGIRRSISVAPTIGGGSVPSVEGLDWLKEKGYKTFVDLRQGVEVEPTFADAVNDRGMVYISLPIMSSRLDPNRLARFDDLISQSSNRPLYFCDSDGSRAGLVWYLHLRNIEGDDAQAAAQKAEDVGLTEAQLKQADAYLTTHKPKPRVALANPRSDAPDATEPRPIAPAAEAAPAPAMPTVAEPPAPAATSAPVPTPSDSPPLPMLPGENRPQASRSSDTFRDPALWRPVAALVLTGVGVPLAYWSRSALSGVRSSVRRASLPASERRSLEAPAASDV